MPPPCVAAKAKLVGLAPMAGGTGAAVTVNVTGTVTGVAPVALRVMVALYVPAVRVPVVTLAVIVPLLVPEVGLTVSQPASSLTVHAVLDVTVMD